MFTIEYDDGESLKSKSVPEKHISRRGRKFGFYLNGRPLPVGYMRVSEMEPLRILLEELCQAHLDSVHTPTKSDSLMSRVSGWFKNILKK